MEKHGLDNPGLDLDPEDPIIATFPKSNIDIFEDLPEPELNRVQKLLAKSHSFVYSLLSQSKYEKYLTLAIKIGLGVLCKIYFIAAILHYTNGNNNIEWCDGFGFLLILTVFVDFTIVYFYLLKPTVMKMLESQRGQTLQQAFWNPLQQMYNQLMSKWWSSLVINICVFLTVLIFLLIDTIDDRRRLVSFFGLCILICLAVLGSNNPSRIK